MRQFRYIFVFVVILGLTGHAQLINAQFLAPDTVCVNQTFTVVNTTTGTVNSWYWNTCTGPYASVQNLTSLGNPGGLLATPVYITINQDNGNYYGFVTSNTAASGTIVRLNFGNSLLNTPTAVNLGNLGSQLPAYCEDIFIRKEGTTWYGVVVGGNPTGSLTKINFGTSLSNNSPVATNVSVPNLLYPHNIEVFEVGGSTYAFVCNRVGNSITRLSFGSSLNNTPASVLLGSFGLSAPSQMCLINSAGNWHLFVTNDGSSVITRLDFGNNLLNTPAAVSLGNPSTLLAGPRGIALDPGCSQIVGLVGNASGSTVRTATINGTATGPLSLAPSLGPTNGINFPQTIYRTRINDLSSYFIVNATGNSVSRVDYSTCNVVPSSTLQNPPAFTFTAPGVYTINLTCNDGEYNQAKYCKQVVVLSAPNLSVSGGGNICAGGSLSINAATQGSAAINWSGPNLFSSSSPTVSFTNINLSQSGIYSVTAGNFVCTSSGTILVNVFPMQGLVVTNAVGCPSAVVSASASGAVNYTWMPGNVSGSVLSVPLYTPGTFTVFATDQNGCSSTATTSLQWHTIQAVSVSPASAVACPSAVVTITASGAQSYTWLPVTVSGSVLNIQLQNPGNYTVSATDQNGCSSSATIDLLWKPVPSFSFATFSITCGSLGSATITPAGGIGPFSYTWNPTSQTGNTGANFFPGPYTVTALDQGSSCIFTPTVQFFPLVPMTGTVSNSPANPCNGVASGTASVLLSNGSGSQNYSWTSPGGVQTQSLAINLSAGTHTLSVTDALTFCNVTQTFFISQPPALSVNISSGSPSVCLGSSIAHTAQAGGGTGAVSYSWIGGPLTSTWNVSEAGPGNYVYTVQATDANSCTASQFVQSIFVSNPVLTISNPTVCSMQPATISAGGASSYTWNNNTNGSSLTAVNAVTTSYTVTGAAQGCSSQVVGTIYILPLPQPTINTNSPRCQGDSICFSANGAVNYFWTGPNAFSSTLSALCFTSVQPSITGQYSLHVISADGCTASITKPLVVWPQPQLTVNQPVVCEGSSILLAANFLPATSYSWSGPSFSSTQQNPVIPNAQITSAGNYSLQVINNNGCKNSAIAQVSVASNFTTSVSGPSVVCSGSSFTVSAQPGYSPAWHGPNGFYSGQPAISFSNIPLTAQGTYSLVQTKGPCTNTALYQLTVNPLPNLTIQSNSPFCENNKINLSASGAASYSWSGPANFSAFVSSVTILNGSPQNAGIYSVVANSTSNCTSGTTVNVIMLPAPVPAASSATTCIGGSVTLLANGASTYTWTGPLGLTAFGYSLALLSAQTGMAGVYTITATGINNCTASASASLAINNEQPPKINIVGAQSVCMADTIKLNASGGEFYSWTGPASFTSNLSFINMVATATTTGIYSLQIVAPNGCTNSQTLALKILPSPVGRLVASADNLCVPACISIQLENVSSNGGIITYSVSSASSKITPQDKSWCIHTAGVYSFTAMFRDSLGCSGESKISLSAFEKPRADFQYSPQHPIAGIDQLNLYNSSSGASQVSWNWHIKGKDSSAYEGTLVKYMFEVAGEYAVALVVKNRWGCADTIIKPVLIDDDLTLYVPSAFSPNGDDVNDVFLPKGQGIHDYRLNVFNRWGQLIFSSSEFESGWNGTFRGKDAPPDIYAWKISCRNFKGKLKEMTGHVQLLR